MGAFQLATIPSDNNGAMAVDPQDEVSKLPVEVPQEFKKPDIENIEKV